MIRKTSLCTGCSACKNICPMNAIDFSSTSEGFLYPNVTLDKCIHCNLCEKVCQLEDNNLLKLKNKLKIECYALYAKDSEIRKKSSSGGMFTLISNYVLSKNGFVFGAKLNDDFSLTHVGINQETELNLLRGSKYFQSDVSKSFPEIKARLEEDKLVYFCGTPCQVVGLKLYLNKEYSNLITSDLVCHGVPSIKFFLKYKKYLEEKINSKLVSFSFRKVEGWSVLETAFFIKGKKKFKIQKPDYCSPYLYNFLKAKLFRESCYTCPFSKPERYGDFTIGDFWGIRNISKIDYESGVSLVLVNSEKAKSVFEEIKKESYFELFDFDIAAKYNPNLLQPSSRPQERDGAYEKLEYEDAFDSFFKVPNIQIRKIRFLIVSVLDKLRVKKIIKKVIGL